MSGVDTRCQRGLETRGRLAARRVCGSCRSLYAFWTAFHPAEFSTRFALAAPLTLDNFAHAWDAAPFARYFLNSFLLVTMVLAAQLVLCTLAALRLRALRVPGQGHRRSRWC